MRKAYKIDEFEYKRALKLGAEVLIRKDQYPKNARVFETFGEYWLEYETDEIARKAIVNQPSEDYLNGGSHAIY